MHTADAAVPEQHGPAYDDFRNAAAYNIMRMPATFAVAFRVLRELRICRPEISPSSLLDFGAGPGTAIWAAQQVHCSSCRIQQHEMIRNWQK